MGGRDGQRSWRAGRLWLLCAVLPLTSGAVQEVNGPGAKLFAQRCASCHTVGEGVRVGPDLKGVLDRRPREWITRFVKSPGAAIDSGDPIALGLMKSANGVRMPDQTLSAEELAALFAFWTECTQKDGCRPGTGRPRLGTEATPEELALGRALFEGATSFAAGGPSCVSCHSTRESGPVGGGGLGPELTFAYAKLGEKGLHPGLGNGSSPLMRAVYDATPLTSDEGYAVKGYLAQLSRDGALPRRDWNLFGLGAAGLLAVLGAIGVGRFAHSTDSSTDGEDRS